MEVLFVSDTVSSQLLGGLAIAVKYKTVPKLKRGKTSIPSASCAEIRQHEIQFQVCSS